MNTIPLSDALPWDRNNPPSHGCLLVVTDSTETDGRFLLHTIAAQYLSSNHGFIRGRSKGVVSGIIGNRDSGVNVMGTITTTSAIACRRRKVLWISCGAYLEQNILSAIKKIGTKEGMAGMDRLSSSALWDYISVCDEMVSSLSKDCHNKETNDHGETDNPEMLSSSSFGKALYERIKNHLLSSVECNENGCTMFCWLVVLDDVLILSQLLDSYALLALIQRIRAFIQSRGGCFIIRTSNEAEREQIRIAAATKEDYSSTSPQWVGAGGGYTVFDNVRSVELQHHLMSWNHMLPELADGIIDVMPLQSGFSREAHGRLICTEILGGRGWVDRSDSIQSGYTKTAASFNYFCGESDVKAIHLGSKT